jgi:hypothetical protein
MDFSTIPLPLLSFFWVFFISSTPTLQMANTRNRNNNNDEDNNGENNRYVNTPPPPPPTLKQVLVMQIQMLQTITSPPLKRMVSRNQDHYMVPLPK